MNKGIVGVLLITALLTAAAIASTERAPRAVKPAGTTIMAPKAVLDTVFFDDFETDKGWTVTDMAVQAPYWHADTYNAFAGQSFWCGTATDVTGWANPPGYGDGWAQFLISPQIDLTSIDADSIILSFWHNYRLEMPEPTQDWDCIDVWMTTSDDESWNLTNWQCITPDTIRFPGTGYNVDNPYSWHYVGLVPDSVLIPGWGGLSPGWLKTGFDLTAYKGQKVRFCFIGTSDAAQSDQTQTTPVDYHGMWYLDNISVDTVSAGGTRGNVYFENCEAGMGSWRATGKEPVYFWHQTTRRSNSPTQAWWNGNETTGTYRWGQSDALTSPLIDLRLVRPNQPCYINFKTWLDIPDDGSDENELNDWYKFEFSADSGRTWVDPWGIFIDTARAWVDQTNYSSMDISSFVGGVIQVRIGFGSDGDNNTGEGMYVDDFIVMGKMLDSLPGPNSLLLVDDDGNAIDIQENSWTKYAESSLISLGYHHSLATVGFNKTITPGYLEQFPAVIWNLGADYDQRTGPDYRALTQMDIAAITSYLDNGGKLLMFGQFYFVMNPDTTNHPNLWIDYLRINDSIPGWWGTMTTLIDGVAGDPISDGFTDLLSYDRLNGGGIPWTSPYNAFALVPDSSAMPQVAGFMKNEDSTWCGLRFWNGTPDGYRFAYVAFPFEAVSTSDKRDTLMGRLLKWLVADTFEYGQPSAPTGFSVVQDYDSVICQWSPNTEPDLAGYAVYRALQMGNPEWQLIGTTPASRTTFVDTLIQVGMIYAYAVVAYDSAYPANRSAMSQWRFIRSVPWVKTNADGNANGQVPHVFALSQNHPNPFLGPTHITYALPRAGHVHIAVYNISGQRVASLVDGHQAAGFHTVNWQGLDAGGHALSSGVYFYRMEVREAAAGQIFRATKRMTLLQ